jgi:hypothetical protein
MILVKFVSTMKIVHLTSTATDSIGFALIHAMVSHAEKTHCALERITHQNVSAHLDSMEMHTSAVIKKSAAKTIVSVPII